MAPWGFGSGGNQGKAGQIASGLKLRRLTAVTARLTEISTCIIGAHGVPLFHARNQTLASMNAVSWAFDKAPTLVAASWPPLKIISVGMPRMPNLAGTSRF